MSNFTCVMSNSSRVFLQKHYPAFFSFGTLSEALNALDDYIVMEGLDENDNMTDFGHQLQAIYDEIYMCTP